MAKNERRGATRLRGPTGARGIHGVRGLPGPAGPRGPHVTRAQIVKAVASEFDRLHQQVGEMHERLDRLTKQLEVQLLQFAQIQQQLDDIHKLLQRMLEAPRNGPS